MEIVGIDLFSGAGGLSLGAQEAGIRVALAIEADRHAALTYAHNLGSTEVLLGDIRMVTKSQLSKVALGAAITIVFGGAPCQGFSYSNQRTRNVLNEGNWLYLEFLRIVSICRPDWVVFENVKGIKDTEKGVFLADLLNRLSGLGYEVSARLLNAADFGVPQCRERLFVIGSAAGLIPELAPTSHRVVTVGEAIRDLPSLANGASTNWRRYKSSGQSEYSRLMRGDQRTSSNHLVTRNADHIVRRYRHIPQGGNWKYIPDNLMGSYRQTNLDLHTGLYRRLHVDRTSVPIGNYRKNMLIHPVQERGLSVREAARLQSFPDWYEFKGSIGFQQQQVGNAVPPLLANAVFAAIVAASGGA